MKFTAINSDNMKDACRLESQQTTATSAPTTTAFKAIRQKGEPETD